MGAGAHERTLALVREWPRDQETRPRLRRTGGPRRRAARANGYDPMVPLRTRAALGGMGVGGTLPGAFFRTDPARLEMLGIRWVEVPAAALSAPAHRLRGRPRGREAGAGAAALLPAAHRARHRDPGRLARSPTRSRVPQGAEVARVEARLATGRSFELSLRAGVDTAEWA